VLERVVLDETIEVFFQCTGHFGRPTRAETIDEAWGPWGATRCPHFLRAAEVNASVSEDGLQAVPFDHLTDSLGTAEDPSLFGLF
jgi:hypothetical protein